MTETALTDGEMRILRAIFANMNGKPDVDWDSAAAAASLGNAKSIKERYRQMCHRLGWNKKNDTGTGSAPATPKKAKQSPSKVVKRTPASGRGRKKQSKEEDEDEDEEDTPMADDVVKEGEF